MKKVINITKKELKNLKYLTKLSNILATKIDKNIDEDNAHYKNKNNNNNNKK